jgi:DNA-binding NtrC family response regulator
MEESDMHDQADNSNQRPRIFHISSREQIKALRDQILRLHGFEVESMVYSGDVVDEVAEKDYDLVLLDVDTNARIPGAQQLCDSIKKHQPELRVAFVCDHAVSVQSNCPDGIIHAAFDPEALVRGVTEALT